MQVISAMTGNPSLAFQYPVVSKEWWSLVFMKLDDYDSDTRSKAIFRLQSWNCTIQACLVQQTITQNMVDQKQFDFYVVLPWSFVDFNHD